MGVKRMELSRRMASACRPVVGAAMIWLGSLAPGMAAPAEPAAARSVTIGYVELTADPRYAEKGERSAIFFADQGRPFGGSAVAMDDARAIGRVINVQFDLDRFAGASVDAIAERITRWIETDGVHFVIADLPGSALRELGRRFAGKPVLLFNVSAPDDALRGADCAPILLHTYPSQAMLADALVQFLVAKGWPQILALQGPAPEDAASVAALQRSAKKFGARIVETRPFVLSNDPRHREQSNVALMTGGARYDVVFVADSSGEFGRFIPYQVSLPRPVVGSAGLTPSAWFWSWDRDAAVQLQHRYEKAASPRRMGGADWAAWEAGKAVVQATVQARSADFDAIKAALLSDRLNLDTEKGNPGNFRPWDHQLRAPVLLGTADAVIERAPLPQFLHQSNVLDTLGVDAPETACRF